MPPLMNLDRAAGVLLHITSLPGEFGIGDLGQGAHRFIDFLSAAHQRVWQVLPLSPTLHGDSPYSSYSAFAGNPSLISLAKLVDVGLLTHAHLDQVRSLGNPSNEIHCDYSLAHRAKRQALELAFEHFLTHSKCTAFDEFEAFCTHQKWWLDDFALFAALMKHFGTDNWSQWDSELVARKPQAIGAWKHRLEKAVEYEQFVQYVFYSQWNELHRYARSKDVQLFGDMPIFVAHGSADVWAHQSSFSLKRNGEPKTIAGVPPDYFSKTGQLWGNPQYDWDSLQAAGYLWWIQRLKSAFDAFDLLRIDHFRGFEAYWEVDASAKTAVSGRWVKGPGAGPFDAAQAILGELPIVAEDLGLITDEVHALREKLGFPGMRVLQFGYDNETDVYHRAKHFPEHSVAYTGTHDNSTILGWYQQRKSTWNGEDPFDVEMMAFDHVPELHWKMVSMVHASQARLAIIPMQDLLGLDDSARMNMPGLAEGNWAWRCPDSQLTDDLAITLRDVTDAHGRG